MIRHYIDFALRTLRKHIGYTLIHIAGLSCGFAVALLIFSFVRSELSYDDFHHKRDKIARLIALREYGDGQLTPIHHMPLPLGPAILEEVPSAKQFVRVSGADHVHVIGGEIQDYEYVTFADASLFSIFDFPLVHSSASSVLGSPTEAVLTRATATKYFGTTEIVGHSIDMFLQGTRRTFTVVGVAEDVPSNSSINFTIVVPMQAIFRYDIGSTRWNWWRVKTFVEFDRPVGEVDTNLVSGIIANRWTDRTRDEPVPLRLQPLPDVHFDSASGESNISYSYILSGIAFIILLIAGINYVSLGIARGASRAREVAVRKLFGAVRKQVIWQLLAESTILALLSILAGFMIAEIAMPTFSSFVGRSLELSAAVDTPLVGFGVAIALVTGFTSGLVPAFVLSRPHPAEVLRKASTFARSGPFMRSLIVVQFALSVFLIIATLVMNRQLSYFRDRPLGYNAEAVMVVQRPPDNSINDVDFLQTFKNELAADPRIVAVSATSASFNQGYDVYGWNTGEKQHSAHIYRVDPSYIETLGMKIVEGRDFATDPTLDATNPIVVNESLMEQLGTHYAVGSTVPALDTLFENLGTPTIIGVVKDYHFLSLHEQIGPAMLFTRELYPYFQLLVRVDSRDLQGAAAAVESAYERVSSGLRCNWTYLSEDLANQYSTENRWSRIITSSGMFAIGIAALGIFGLAGIATIRRSKEVGVRKVLGASVYQILNTINREFLLMVVVANSIAWPIAWYASRKWLEGFAYRIDLTIWIFVLAAMTVLTVAIIAVSCHTLRAALESPTRALRQE